MGGTENAEDRFDKELDPNKDIYQKIIYQDKNKKAFSKTPKQSISSEMRSRNPFTKEQPKPPRGPRIPLGKHGHVGDPMSRMTPQTLRKSIQRDHFSSDLLTEYRKAIPEEESENNNTKFDKNTAFE